MTSDRHFDTVLLQRLNAEQIVILLRESERFLDDCVEETADVLDDNFGFGPATESFSAALSLAADNLDAALAHPRASHADRPVTQWMREADGS